MDGPILIKGTREGLTITLGAGDTQKLYDELTRHLKVQGVFFRGGVVALNVGARPVDAPQLASFRDLLAGHTMVLRTIIADDASTRQAAEELGLRAIGDEKPPSGNPQPLPEPQPIVAPPSSRLSAHDEASQAGARGLFLRRRVRAGQVVHHTGSVLVIGDVNVGAQIIAGGDVVVWGRLRGTVHAGYPDNQAAIVCALDLAPLQLRIGSLITRPEETAGERRNSYPEVAQARGEAIVVERWTGIRWEE